jgi:hypothetical protein
MNDQTNKPELEAARERGSETEAILVAGGTSTRPRPEFVDSLRSRKDVAGGRPVTSSIGLVHLRIIRQVHFFKLRSPSDC